MNDPAWHNTLEGGMVVKLVVLDDRGEAEEFAQCSGAYVVDVLSESFIGDDKRPLNLPPAANSIESLQAEQQAVAEWESWHFPHLHHNEIDGVEKYLSRPYLAALVMGSTGWSGAHAQTGELWRCSYQDLTEDGKHLYQQIAALYPGCELHLLTFLDT